MELRYIGKERSYFFNTNNKWCDRPNGMLLNLSRIPYLEHGLEVVFEKPVFVDRELYLFPAEIVDYVVVEKEIAEERIMKILKSYNENASDYYNCIYGGDAKSFMIEMELLSTELIFESLDQYEFYDYVIRTRNEYYEKGKVAGANNKTAEIRCCLGL